MGAGDNRMPFESFGIEQLSVPERLQLVDYILASLPEQVHPSELSAEQHAEIDRRCAAADADPQGGKPWREVLDRIEKSL
jgi:putative addiction module component (TIGR02574 family)